MKHFTRKMHFTFYVPSLKMSSWRGKLEAIFEDLEKKREEITENIILWAKSIEAAPPDYFQTRVRAKFAEREAEAKKCPYLQKQIRLFAEAEDTVEGWEKNKKNFYACGYSLGESLLIPKRRPSIHFNSLGEIFPIPKRGKMVMNDVPY